MCLSGLCRITVPINLSGMLPFLVFNGCGFLMPSEVPPYHIKNWRIRLQCRSLAAAGSQHISADVENQVHVGASRTVGACCLLTARSAEVQINRLADGRYRQSVTHALPTSMVFTCCRSWAAHSLQAPTPGLSAP